MTKSDNPELSGADSAFIFNVIWKFHRLQECVRRLVKSGGPAFSAGLILWAKSGRPASFPMIEIMINPKEMKDMMDDIMDLRESVLNLTYEIERAYEKMPPEVRETLDEVAKVSRLEDEAIPCFACWASPCVCDKRESDGVN